MNGMIVNHFNTFPYGGAATAALRLHAEYLNRGLDSRFLYCKRDREPDSTAPVSRIQWSTRRRLSDPFQQLFEKRRVRRIYRMFDQHLAQRDPHLELFSMAEGVERNRLTSHNFEDGIVHLHWIAFMSDFQSLLGSIPNQTPIVWTLHDMNPFTGGCHYSDGCQRFESGCGNCPQILQPGIDDLSNHSFNVKARALRLKNLTIVSPSRWMLDLARSSQMFPRSTRFHHIRLGFDLRKLYPQDQLTARRRLGIDPAVPLIGFGAETVANPRKGVDLLLPALAELKNRRMFEVAVFGAGKFDEAGFELPRIHELGYVSELDVMRAFYSACDVVVVPSREDNQPQVGLEAMACGTPVVAFDVGGIGEYVNPGVTGWLARPESSRDLAVQIEKLIGDREMRLNMSERARQLIVREFEITKQADSYIQLYSSLLSPISKRRSA